MQEGVYKNVIKPALITERVAESLSESECKVPVFRGSNWDKSLPRELCGSCNQMITNAST